MTTEEYQKDLDTEKPLIEFHGVLIQIPFYLSPKDNEYPLDILDNLGEYPIKVTEEEISLTILYPGGKVVYVENEGVLIPKMVRIFGVTTQEGVPSLNTEHLDTNIFFEQVHEDEIDPEGEYLHFGDLHLKIERIDGEKENINDWWTSEKRG